MVTQIENQRRCSTKFYSHSQTEASKQIGPALERERTQSGSQWAQSGSVPTREWAQMEWRESPSLHKLEQLTPSDAERGR